MMSMERRPLAYRTTAFVVFTLGLVATCAGILSDLMRLAWTDATRSHILVIPLVSIALIYADRVTIFRSVKTALAIGSLVVFVGVAFLIASQSIGHSQDSLTLAGTGVCLAWIGGFIATYGQSATRAAAFPLVFLIFMIPPPDVLISGATSFLKGGSTETVAGLFSLTGTPYFREGFSFALPSLVIEIADECSGIRSSIALFLTGLLAGHQFLRTPWAKTVLVLAILPVALLKNAIRIVSLSLLAMHVSPSFITGQLHQEGGILFFVLALALMAPLFALLRWSESRRIERSAVES